MAAIPKNPKASLPMKDPKQSISIPSNLLPRRFPTYLEAPNISPPVLKFCETLTRVSPLVIESELSRTGITPTDEVVRDVLALSYNQPPSAIKFFRWAGSYIKHSAFTWNVMVDLLGQNQLFESMWDAIRSMKQEGLLTIATFVSAFGSYCAAHRFKEVFMSFDVMEKYGIQQDVVALNALLSAICRVDNQMMTALEFFDKIKEKIQPDEDTFAILMEGWEKEGNVAKAKTTFGEMVLRLGWSQKNLPAYDAFMITLIRGAPVDETFKFLQVMKNNSCLPGLKFFSLALDILGKQNDHTHIIRLWDTMVGGGLVPNLVMYNTVIGIMCNKNDVHAAFRFLDGMVFHGAFPDSMTYNMIFECLVRNKRVREVGKFFNEMIKNEFPPSHSHCATAITMLLENDDPEQAIEIWNYMAANDVSPVDGSANALLLGLGSLGRLSEVRRFGERMLDRKVNIHESTMEQLKASFYREGRLYRDKYDSLAKRWKDIQM